MMKLQKVMLRKDPDFAFKNNQSENQRNSQADQPSAPNYTLHNMQIWVSERIQNIWTAAKCKFKLLVFAYPYSHLQPGS